MTYDEQRIRRKQKHEFVANLVKAIKIEFHSIIILHIRDFTANFNCRKVRKIIIGLSDAHPRSIPPPATDFIVPNRHLTTSSQAIISIHSNVIPVRNPVTEATLSSFVSERKLIPWFTMLLFKRVRIRYQIPRPNHYPRSQLV